MHTTKLLKRRGRMYRVFDKKKNQWVDDIIKDTQGTLYKVKKSIFGKRIIYINQDRYICHDFFGLYDKNNIKVFEGDYLKAEVDKNKSVIGLVSFINDLSAYVILVESTQEYFTLGSEISEFIELIGNVFDGYTDERYKNQQAL